jgi:long-chain acyl-CoA synthetase
MKKSVFITGASGSVGREILRRWAGRDDVEAHVLVHNSIPDGLSEEAGAVRFVRGDITRPGLGLSLGDRTLLTRRLTHVLHSAANTRFDQSWSTAYRSNVLGTANMLEFASACSKLRHFGHVSTSFVAGKRWGTVLEDDLEHAAGYTNHYERSKNMAERLVRARSRSMPIGVYRPSIILGDSRDGHVCGMQASHQVIRMLSLIGASEMPGTPDYVLDMVPTDLVAKTISSLLLDRPDPGTYHITAGPEKSFSLLRFFDAVYRHFGEIDATWPTRGLPFPRVVPSSSMDRRSESLQLMQHFAEQLEYSKVYDRSRLNAVIPEYEAEVPHGGEYLGRVIDFLIRTSWCRKAA